LVDGAVTNGERGGKHGYWTKKGEGKRQGFWKKKKKTKTEVGGQEKGQTARGEDRQGATRKETKIEEEEKFNKLLKKTSVSQGARLLLAKKAGFLSKLRAKSCNRKKKNAGGRALNRYARLEKGGILE